MISHKYKCIYIHINKCGGNSIQKQFAYKDKTGVVTPQGGHKKAFQYKNKYPTEFDEYFKFTFVRNPWDRVVSFYHYQVVRKWDCYPLHETIPFYEFVRNWLRSMPGQPSLNTHSCHDWISDENDKLMIDFIGRLENFQQDFNIVCDKIGIHRRKLPHLNKTEHKHYTKYYNDETREIVAEKYAKDIEYFGYEFGE